MRRFLLGTIAVIIANIVALVLFWFFVGIDLVISTKKPWLTTMLDGLFLIGVFGGVIVFTTVFPISLILSYIGLLFHWTNRWIYIAGGTLIGLAFTLYGYQDVPLSGIDQRNALFFIGIGAICGWIYWRIAVREETASTQTQPLSEPRQ